MTLFPSVTDVTVVNGNVGKYQHIFAVNDTSGKGNLTLYTRDKVERFDMCRRNSKDNYADT